jgi:hypothetical protein
MKLPQVERVRIEEKKLVEYLLNINHPEGQSKAVFFRQCGFQKSEWEALAAALRKHAQRHEVTETRRTGYGTHYVVEGKIETPDMERPFIRTVWIEEDDRPPRLVTAHPLPK